MGIHDGHRERKKQQFLRRGAGGFADHELLELALFFAVPRCDTNVTAHRLIDAFGSLQGVFDASADDLKRVEGVGENAAILLRLIPEIVKRTQQTVPKERNLSSVNDCGNYLMQILRGETREILYQLCLDSKGKLITCCQLSEGDTKSTPLSVRQVANNALRYEASAVVLGHNHPSGVALPSEADRVATLHLRDALQMLDIRLFDHIVVADGDYVSMAQSGLLL